VDVLQFESFSPYLNSTFAVRTGEAKVELVLTQATRAPTSAYPGMAREPFSLTFQSASPEVLPQSLYAFDHPAMGQLDIFIVPIGREGGGVVYQAVFN
jgi:hypothetical protein